MIRKVSVAVYVHCLKYGMLSSKGHAVSIPHDIHVLTKLPQLPSEVGILLVRSGKNQSKAYCASRENVQCALEGLVFGYPKFGIDDQLPCLLYTSPSPRDKRQSRMPSSA